MENNQGSVWRLYSVYAAGRPLVNVMAPTSDLAYDIAEWDYERDKGRGSFSLLRPINIVENN